MARTRLWISTTLLLLVIACSLLPCEAKKKAKKVKKEKAEEKKEEEKKERKPWNKMTKEDWERLEREAEGPGEPWKPPEPPKVQFDPKNPMEYMQASKKGKPAMMFATLDKIKDPKTGEWRERDKAETEELAFRHKSLMQSGHLEATPYVIDPNKILWTVQDGSKGYEVKKFLMEQPEVEEFEWDQKKTTKASWNKEKPSEL
mmetsp:Transcript_45542/g.143038  ORF Transcript_45542/g.143038 Transcript_45542/m.143038 type:complete len:202 (+) Transcript_45542:23-628(+)